MSLTVVFLFSICPTVDNLVVNVHQKFLIKLNQYLGLEWYQVILCTALCMRMMTFPFVVMSQKNMVNMNNNMPGMAALQEKMTEARCGPPLPPKNE